MKIENHGLSIDIERVEDYFFLKLKAQGILTHKDYQIITPMIDSALVTVKDPKVRAFIDLTQLQGWQPRVMWDDFKLGLKHGNAFEKIAICGSKKWQEIAIKIGAWFIAGEIKYFEDENEAITWLINTPV